MNRISLVAALLAATACTPPGERPESLPAPDSSGAPVVTGTVRIVGSAPMNVQVVLQPSAGGGIRLTGPLVGELERLAGLEVAVRGPIRPSPDPIVNREMEATGYEIVSANGRGVVMGEIIAVQAGIVRLRTEDGEEVTLSGAPDHFRVGQKVWIQGPSSIAVQSYGVIRP